MFTAPVLYWMVPTLLWQWSLKSLTG